MTRRTKDLYEYRGRWRDQVFADPSIKGTAFKVAYALSIYMTMNETAQRYVETGRVQVFPNQASLAHDAQLSVDTIRININRLVRRGHLKRVRHGNQIGGATVYGLLFKRQQDSSDHANQHPLKTRDASP